MKRDDTSLLHFSDCSGLLRFCAERSTRPTCKWLWELPRSLRIYGNKGKLLLNSAIYKLDAQMWQPGPLFNSTSEDCGEGPQTRTLPQLAGRTAGPSSRSKAVSFSRSIFS